MTATDPTSRNPAHTTPEAPPLQTSGLEPECLPPVVRERLSQGFRCSVLRHIPDASKRSFVAAFGDLFADLVSYDSGILVGRANAEAPLLEDLRTYVAELALAAEGIWDIGRQPQIDPVHGPQLQLCESVAKVSSLLVALTLVLADLAQDPALPPAELARRLAEARSSTEAGGPILDPCG